MSYKLTITNGTRKLLHTGYVILQSTSDPVTFHVEADNKEVARVDLSFFIIQAPEKSRAEVSGPYGINIYIQPGESAVAVNETPLLYIGKKKEKAIFFSLGWNSTNTDNVSVYYSMYEVVLLKKDRKKK